MKHAVLIGGLILSTCCLADSRLAFEAEYLKIMDVANIAKYKKYKFDNIHDGKKLSSTEQLEAKQIECDALKTELQFYEFVNKQPNEYVAYMNGQGLKIDHDLEKFNQEFI